MDRKNKKRTQTVSAPPTPSRSVRLHARPHPRAHPALPNLSRWLLCLFFSHPRPSPQPAPLPPSRVPLPGAHPLPCPPSGARRAGPEWGDRDRQPFRAGRPGAPLIIEAEGRVTVRWKVTRAFCHRGAARGTEQGRRGPGAELKCQGRCAPQLAVCLWGCLALPQARRGFFFQTP